ncbi:MAG: WGR domain-containing protein [Acidobacteriota bacterium]
MKLIKQTVLNYRQGSSEKIYEINLCEVGQNRYVVNFRYGRRGSNLKEGTKTVGAVPLTEAQKVFEELVNSKIMKGYRAVGEAPTAAHTTPVSARTVTPPADSNARNQAILNRLANPNLRRTPSGKKPWPLERAIWRAGELKLQAATPLLVNLIGTGDGLRDYCIAWALGWCGDESVMGPLGRLYSTSAYDAVRRIAGEALLKLSDHETRAEFQTEMIGKLPIELRELAQQGPAEAFAQALNVYLQTGEHQRFAVLDTIYLIDNAQVRPALLQILRKAPLQTNYFQRLRHIFKAAEYRRDAEVFGIIAYRFEKVAANYNNDSCSFSQQTSRNYSIHFQNSYIQNPQKEITSATSKLAYCTRTRTYLRRRVWRTLRHLGELGDSEYVKMAVGMLLPFSDADAMPVKQSNYYSHRIYWDAYAGYWTFNHILYHNSKRYELKHGSKAWRCRPSYKPGDPEPNIREEAFSKLWEEQPVGLLHLISESNCQPVHHFAVKALRTCQQFCQQLDNDAVVMMLNRPYEVTAKLGFELAQERYRPDAPDLDLVLAVANCAYSEARLQAHRWISDRRERFLNDSAFIVSLVSSNYSDTRDFARNLLRSVTLSEAITRTLIARLVAHLLTVKPGQAELAKDISETVLKCFGPQLRTIGLNVVYDLLNHNMLEVQELAGNILLNHDIRAADLPEELILAIINSGYQPICGISIKLLTQLSDDALRNRVKLLASLAAHRFADVRSSIRPVIRRLAYSGLPADFIGNLVALLLDTLLVQETSEGVHNNLVNLLQEDIGGWMAVVGKERVWQLLQAKGSATQQLGGILLAEKIQLDTTWAESFDLNEIVKLSNHEVKAVREASWQLFERIAYRCQHHNNPDHVQEMSKAIRLLDSKWDDSREHWFAIFQSFFVGADFTPAILVSICDSVREDVGKLGRDLITRYFQEEVGQEYMLKLSEHPSADLQSFVTNYLERYASDNPAHLQELKPYFISVLSRVNKARVAKRRVLSFLAAEARKSVAAAEVVGEILTRQSLTIAIRDKAIAIETMLELHNYYPDLTLPIQVKPMEVRHAV